MNKILPILLIFAATAAPAFAYIAPNAGGLIAQVLTPLLLVMGVAWAAFSRKIAGLKEKVLRRLRPPGGDDGGQTH